MATCNEGVKAERSEVKGRREKRWGENLSSGSRKKQPLVSAHSGQARPSEEPRFGKR